MCSASSTLRGRPNLVPLARDDALFNAVRSLTSSRSYSASEPRTPIIMRPAAVGVVTKVSRWSVADTVTRRAAVVDARKMKMFAVIDHSGEATNEGLGLRDTKLVIFGSPTAGTPVMVAAPLAALDLPLPVLVWADNPRRR